MPEQFDESKIKKYTPKDAVRQRAAMFFGATGPAAIPPMLGQVIDAIVDVSPDYAGDIQVEVQNGTITITFSGLNSPLFQPSESEKWIELGIGRTDWHRSYVSFSAYASDRFILESCDGSQLTRYESHDDAPVTTNITPATNTPFLRITLHPVENVFGTPNIDILYKISGLLRDASLLQPGLATSLRADLLRHEIKHYYHDGLASVLFEEDYFRWPLHPGYLSFKATENNMSVEGYLRFLHAGTPRVRTWVNRHPTQGGTHLDGLGLALTELFPDPSQGCRKMTLVTNPDTGVEVILPHCMIGALHLRLPNPQYRGPTRDVLDNSEVLDFVHRAATATLKQQWQSFGR